MATMQSNSPTYNRVRRVYDPTVALSLLIHDASSSARRFPQHQMENGLNVTNSEIPRLCSRPPLPRTPGTPRRPMKKQLPVYPVIVHCKSTTMSEDIRDTAVFQYSMNCETSNNESVVWIGERTNPTQRKVVIDNLCLFTREQHQGHSDHYFKSSPVPQTPEDGGESRHCPIRIDDLYTTMEEGDVDDRGKCFIPRALRILCERIFPLIFRQGLEKISWYGAETPAVSLSSDSSSSPSMCYSEYSNITC